MTKMLQPIAANLWTDESHPRLIGGMLLNGKVVFPFPEGDAGKDAEIYPLSRTGKLWSWTSQEFEPKEPYNGPSPFAPYLLGYVELPGEVIVETRIVDAALEDLKLGMPMEFVIAPFDERRATYAFRPEKRS